MGIDAARGVAALLVVLYHTARHLDRMVGAPALKQVFQFGHAGVDFFFVISGFIILHLHFGDIGVPARLTRYVGRRFTRVMPAYWVALAATFAIAAVGRTGAPSLLDLAWSASLLPSNREMVLGVAWTLRFEVLFYALFCVLIVNRFAGLVVLGVWFSMAVFAAFGMFDPGLVPDQFYNSYILEFFFGMAAACLLKNGPLPRGLLMLAAGVAIFCVAALLEDIRVLGDHGAAARFAYGIPSALIVLGLVASERHRTPRLPTVVWKMGTASYSIYLFQFVFIDMSWQLLLRTGLNLRLPVIALFIGISLAAVVGGITMSVWVEQPLMRLVRAWCGQGGVRAITGSPTRTLPQ